MKKKGFTLIELLVVISIIALLLSIILPALRSARETARAVICKSQMKQIGTAVVLYTSSNRENYPQTIEGNPSRAKWPGDARPLSGMSDEQATAFVARNATWWGLLGPYTGLESKDMQSMTQLRQASVGTIGNCPSHGTGAAHETVGDRDSFSYTGNGNFFLQWKTLQGWTPRPQPPLKSVSVRNPNTKILVWELFHGADWPLAFPSVSRRGAPHRELLGLIGTQHGWNGDGRLENVGWGATHRQTLNYLFADGSVDSISHMIEMQGDRYEKP